MRYAYKTVNINAPFETKQCGHLSQTQYLNVFKDDLNARIVSFKDDNETIIHISLDLLCFDLKLKEHLQSRLRELLNDYNLYVITSATHTHYANDIRDDKYINYLLDLLIKEIMTLNYIEKENIEVSFVKEHNIIAGKSRISNYETNNEYTCLLNFYENNKLFFSFIINNAHPTTLNANVPYFSSEYPGALIKNLSNDFTNVDFSFIQGASGDISSRFVRDGQDYEDMLKIANTLTSKIKDMLKYDARKNSFECDYYEMPLKFDLNLDDIHENENGTETLSSREKETIEMGKLLRKEIVKGDSYIFGEIQKKLKIGVLKTGIINIIFFPNEIFSDYLNYLDLNKTYLVSYSNGYGPYVLPLDFNGVTYEKYMDISSRKMKEDIIKLIKSI